MVHRSSTSGSSHDVVMVYFQGGEALNAQGHFFLTSVSQFDRELERSAITCDGLAESFSDTLGAKILLLDVERELAQPVPSPAEVRDRVAKWPDDSYVGVLRYSRLPHPGAAKEPRLDVLVNNAGVMPDEREHSADGHELMFATHVLAPFALTALLADLLKRSAPARVINVSSGGMYQQSLHADDLQSEQTEYGPTKLYARTKREEVVISELWGQRPKSCAVRSRSGPGRTRPGAERTSRCRRDGPSGLPDAAAA